MNCDGCIHNPRDWRLCLHPDAHVPAFWENVEDYYCKETSHISPVANPESLQGDRAGCEAPAGSNSTPSACRPVRRPGVAAA